MKKYKYHKRRHTFCYHLIRPVFKLVARTKCRVKYGKVPDPDRPYLILFNHQTAHDQFYIYGLFRRTTYFVASEDLMTMGALSKFISYTCGIVPIRKNTTDATAVKTCCKIAQDGFSVALSPEGNRTYTGKTMYSIPAIAKFVKLLKLPVAFVHIDGGYGVDPRWARKHRFGTVSVSVRRIVEPEEYKQMTADEVMAMINEMLYVDETTDRRVYKDIPTSAEYLERVLYRCPECGSIGTLYSDGRTFNCRNCNLSVKYLPDKLFDDKSPFLTVHQWWEWQNEQVRNSDITDTRSLIAQDTVRADKVDFPRKRLIKKSVDLCLYCDRITADDVTYSFNDIVAFSICGRNKLYMYLKDGAIQFKGDKRFNALKYLNYFYHYKNTTEEMPDDFLGI